MNLYEAIITYSMAWWLFFLMALPFGVHPDPEPQRGNVESAPAKPRLWLKAAVATVLAGLATWGVAWFVDSGFIQLRPGP